jgi:hypothetical protein
MRKRPDELQQEIADAANVQESLVVLEQLLSGGYNVLPNGDLYFIKALVGRVRGLSIYIYPKDHPPPHFHIRGGGLDAAFSIQDCSLLKGRVDSRHHGLIKWWHREAQGKLQDAWERLAN